jgi:protein-S-isoprenylcysteine O-methyltransferase Ste14
MGTRSSTVEENLSQQEPDDADRTRRRSERGGLSKLFYDLKHRRRRFRQVLGAALIFLLTFAGAPTITFLWIGAAFACLGMAVRMWASGFVMKNEVLATSGPYGYVRHPLYVGNLLICVGFCFASGVWWSVPVSLAFLLLFYPETIRYEDKKLRGFFTEEWDEWSARTHALIPRMTPFANSQDGASWTLKRSLMRNGEPLHIVVLGGCLAYLYFVKLV